MAADIDALVTRVERRLIDLPSAITSESITLVNEAIRNACKMHNFHQMKAEVAFTTVDATQDLGDVPARFKEFRDNPFLREGQAGVLGTRPLGIMASLEEALRNYPLDDPGYYGRPQAILREYDDDNATDELWVFPWPDTSSNWSDGLFRIVIPYWRYPATLAAAGSNYFTSNWDEYLVKQATASGFELSWASERSRTWQVLADQELQKLIREDKRAHLTRTATLGVYADAGGSRLDGRM